MLSRQSLSSLTSCLNKYSICSLSLTPTHITDALRSSVCRYGTEAQPKTPSKSSQYKLVVVGGGSGGCAVAAKFASLGKNCAVVEPSDLHYYQPIWTLVGAGLKGFQSSVQPMREVLPESIDWIKDKATVFNPKENYIQLNSGERVHYEYLVVAMGIQLDYDKVSGLIEALENDSTVVSNYHPKWVNKTFPALQEFTGGNAIFTFPNTPIKCAGAPQKIMYLADEYFRTLGVRNKTEIIYNTSLGVIFGVKKYADALQNVVQARDIKVNYKHNLVQVDHKAKVATFEKLDDNKQVNFQYSFLHATPPMSSPDVLKKSPLVNEAGWVDVHKHTLQHNKYPNVFGLGDCTSLPTSKTAAAVAAQSGILHKNLSAVMAGAPTVPLYDGYTSCPLITSSKSCILAEFDYDGKPLETFPFNQGKERKITYDMKAHMMPTLYWRVMLRGRWNGPSTVRKMMHLGLNRQSKLT
uniref:Sulfide:quinone oxidoreductase, mitochondrial n=1 Tax=Arion vulgaris TaxID=1028688 RepID=A0A0B7AQX0_9EUPU